jgi:hypothetical protein
MATTSYAPYEQTELKLRDRTLGYFWCSSYSFLKPPAHQIRHAPSSETMHGPTGLRGVHAVPYDLH